MATEGWANALRQGWAAMAGAARMGSLKERRP